MKTGLKCLFAAFLMQEAPSVLLRCRVPAVAPRASGRHCGCSERRLTLPVLQGLRWGRCLAPVRSAAELGASSRGSGLQSRIHLLSPLLHQRLSVNLCLFSFSVALHCLFSAEQPRRQDPNLLGLIHSHQREHISGLDRGAPGSLLLSSPVLLFLLPSRLICTHVCHTTLK